MVGTWSSQKPIVAITRYAIGNCGSQDEGVQWTILKPKIFKCSYSSASARTFKMRTMVG